MDFVDMLQAGPQLDCLLHRLAECPEEFLLPPREIDVAALACDHFRAMSLTIPTAQQRRLLAAAPAAAQSLMSVVLWLLRDEWFLARPELADAMLTLLHSDAHQRLASLVRAEVIVNDADRREELVRLCLRELGLKPAGESDAQAADRLTTLDSVERHRVIHETRSAEARARQVREAMASKRAAEAAARYSPE